MPRLVAPGLAEALPRARMRSYGTLALTVDVETEIKSYYLATASLNFDGIRWRPDLRESGEITSSIIAEADEATLEIQNVDNLFGIELVGIEEYLSGAEAVVGRYWTDKERGVEWHEVLMTGGVTGLSPNEQSVQLLVVPDTYSGVSVGPFRHIRRLCQFLYQGPECGIPKTGPPTCDFTLNGVGGCHGRWGVFQKVVRHGGMPYLDNKVFQKII